MALTVRRNESPDSEKNWTGSRNQRIKRLTEANIGKKKATAQAAKTNAGANMLTARQRPQLQKMENQGRTKVQGLRNKGSANTQQLRNKGSRATQLLRNKGQASVQEMRNEGAMNRLQAGHENTMDKVTRENEYSREADYRRLGGEMILKGAQPDAAMQNLYNQPGWAPSANVSDLPEIPREKSQAYRFVKIQEPAPTKLNPAATADTLYRVNRATGEYESLQGGDQLLSSSQGEKMEPGMTDYQDGMPVFPQQDQAGSGDDLMYQSAKVVLGEKLAPDQPLTEDQVGFMRSLRRDNPRVYQRIMQEYMGQ